MYIRIQGNFRKKYPKFKKEFISIYGELPNGKASQKLKAIWYYLMHGDYSSAFTQYRKLYEILEKF